MSTILYVDGGCSAPNQKDMSKRRMISVVSDESGKVLSEEYKVGGSNNIAELIAVRDALVWCSDNNVKEVEIKTDSRNNISWVFGNRVGKKLNDRQAVLDLKAEIKLLLTKVSLHLIWVPREENLAGHYIEDRLGL